MKRVAVCISGHVRSFEKGFENFKSKVIDQNKSFEFDFFIDTWETKDWRTEDKFKETSESIEEIKALYRPVKVVVEKDIEWDTSNFMKFVKDPSWVKKGYKKVRSKGEHILGMYYKIRNCNYLKSQHEEENGFEYDLVIRHRTDLGFESKINLDEILKDTKDKIYVAKLRENQKSAGQPINDVLGISSSKNMDEYSKVFDNIEEIVTESEIFRPEWILDFHLKKEKLNTQEVTSPWFII